MLPRDRFSGLPHRRFRRASTALLAALGVAASCSAKLFRHVSSALALPLAVVLWLWTGTAHAEIYTVGTPSGGSVGTCDCGTIQCALDRADGHPGADEVRLTDTLSYYDEYNHSGDSDNLTIIGGFADCATAGTVATLPTGVTRVGGSRDDGGGLRAPVLQFSGTGRTIRLRRLLITEGDAYGGEFAGSGGGIDFQGCITVDLAEVTITRNVADDGGGIAASNGLCPAKLVIGPNVLISDNTALRDGGGVYLSGAEMTMNVATSAIEFNHAYGAAGVGGYGGGVYVSGRYSYPGLVKLGPLSAVAGAIRFNDAKYGAGVAVIAGAQSDGGDARLEVSGIDASPTSIFGNTANSRGGAVYLRPDAGFANAAEMITTGHVRIEGNVAPIGAAAYLDYSQDISGIRYGSSLSMSGGVIASNISREGTTSSTGPILYVGDDPLLFGGLDLHRVDLRYNEGGEVLFNVGYSTLSSLLIANNTTLFNSLLKNIGATARFELTDSTIAGNTISDAYVLRAAADTRLRGSILHQPGKTSLLRTGGTLDVRHVVTSERASLDGGASPDVYQLDPRFIDPARGDFHLRAASPAVDNAVDNALSAGDLEGRARNLDLPFKANGAGRRDIGAYERQKLPPLALNGHFDLDLNLWDKLGSNRASSTWDGTQSASGDAGSGSWKLNDSVGGALPPREYFAGQQCIHLPGPGRYRLNGYGHNASDCTDFSCNTLINNDTVQLRWAFRRAGGEACTDGAADASGLHVLTGRDPTAWNRPVSGAIIDVSPGDWTSNSSITVILSVMDEDSASPRLFKAWYDGIELSVEPPNGPPVLRTPLPDRTDAERAAIDVDFAPYFLDPNGNPLTFRASGLPPGLAFGGQGRAIGTLASDAAAGSPYAVGITADDLNGGTVSDTFVWNVLDAYTLSYSAGANGSLSGTAAQLVTSGGSGSAVTAMPASGYHFAQWSDGQTANPRTDANVTADLDVTAQFAINTYTLSYAAGTNGSITGTSPQTVAHGASGSAITAVPATGHHFVQWSDGQTANPRTDANVTADLGVTAQFAINTYTLSYTAGTNGSVIGTSPQTVAHGASGSAVGAIPATGHHFVQWSDGMTLNPRTDANVIANLSVSAQFAADVPTTTGVFADGFEQR